MKKHGLRDIYRILHPRTIDYAFFSSTHGTFITSDHTLGHSQTYKQKCRALHNHLKKFFFNSKVINFQTNKINLKQKIFYIFRYNALGPSFFIRYVTQSKNHQIEDSHFLILKLTYKGIVTKTKRRNILIKGIELRVQR